MVMKRRGSSCFRHFRVREKGGCKLVAFRDGFLSELVGRPAIVEIDGKRTTIGTVADFVVEHPEDTFPRVDAVVLKMRGGDKLAPIGDVLDIQAEDHAIVL